MKEENELSDIQLMEKKKEYWKSVAVTNARTVGVRDKEILDLLKEIKTLKAELKNSKRNFD